MTYRVTILRSDLEQQNSYLCDDYLLVEGFLILEKPNIATNNAEAIMEEHAINLDSIDEYTVSEVEK